jgi:predicted AlkP superfamily phosphohydrolase/phosphomutase
MLRRILPQSIQDTVSTATASGSDDIVDWSKTRAYYVPVYFHVCGVEVNLLGARREGNVKSGAEYEAIRERVIQEARRLNDTRDGKPIVEMAVRREELYQGPYVEEFPDVILVLDPDYLGASSLAGRSLVEPHPSPMRPGEHRQDGIFLAAGPHVLSMGDLENLRLIDLPPTLMYAMGLSVPPYFDGRVLEEIFDPMFLSSHPISIGDYMPFHGHRPSADEGYSVDEEAALEERLRGLGYID